MTVYFQIGDKKLKMKVETESEEQAKYLIMGKIKWIKFEKEKLTDSLDIDGILNLFNLKQK